MPLRKNIKKGKIKLKSGTVIKGRENTKTGKHKETIKKKGTKKSVIKKKGNTTTKRTGIFKLSEEPKKTKKTKKILQVGRTLKNKLRDRKTNKVFEKANK